MSEEGGRIRHTPCADRGASDGDPPAAGRHTECADYSQRMVQLFAAEADEWSGTDQRTELLELLRRDPQARAVYIEQAILHSLLCQKGRQAEGLPPSLLEIVAPASPSACPAAASPSFLGGAWLGAGNYLAQHPMVLSYLVATVFFAIAIGLSSLIYVSNDYEVATADNNDNSQGLTAPGGITAPDGRAGDAPPLESKVVGRITGTVDCQWAGPQTIPVGRDIALGQAYALSSGLVEITYKAGAKVILQGPCTYEVDSTAGGFLSLGKLTARVERSEVRGQGSEHSSLSPLPSPLFAVRTPTAVVTDLGTEFGVEVSRGGRTSAHVFRGEVRVNCRDPRTGASKEAHVTAGAGAVFEPDSGVLRATQGDGRAFARTLDFASGPSAAHPGRVVNIDINGWAGIGDNWGPGGATYSGQGAYPDPGHNLWNGYELATYFEQPAPRTYLRDSAVNPTTVGFAITCKTREGRWLSVPSNDLLNDGCGVTASEPLGTFKIFGLRPGARYDLYLYGTAGAVPEDSGSAWTVGNVTVRTSGSTKPNFVLGGNYAVIPGVRADVAGEIAGSWVKGGKSDTGPFNGLQIVELPDEQGDSVDHVTSSSSKGESRHNKSQ